MKKKQNAVLILAIILFLWFSIDMLNQTQWFGNHIDFEKASQYGGLIAGIFSFLGVILIYLTLRQQSEAYEQSAFENRFFQLIDYHRKNVESFEYKYSSSKKGELVKGQRVFIYIHREVIKAIEYLKKDLKIDSIEKILTSEEIKRINSNNNISGRKIDILEIEIINLAYLVVFFGVGEEGRRVLERILIMRCEKLKVDGILDFFQNKLAEWDKLANKTDNQERIRKNNHYKYFGGHQHRLGHYFRHVFQTVNYVNKFKSFEDDYDTKYDYIKNYRAQFSTYEQSVFAYNSLSVIGRIWEIQEADENNKLITKYNLIKNIPAEFISEFDLKNYYPNVEYEGYEITPQKERLKKLYK